MLSDLKTLFLVVVFQDSKFFFNDRYFLKSKL